MEFVGGRGISLFKHSLVHSWFNFFSVTWMMMVILLCHFPPAYVFYCFLFSRFHRIPCMNEFLSRCWIYSFQRRMANRIVLNDNRLTFHSCSALFQRRRKSRLSLFLMLPRFLHSFIHWLAAKDGQTVGKCFTRCLSFNKYSFISSTQGKRILFCQPIIVTFTWFACYYHHFSASHLTPQP